MSYRETMTHKCPFTSLPEKVLLCLLVAVRKSLSILSAYKGMQRPESRRMYSETPRPLEEPFEGSCGPAARGPYVTLVSLVCEQRTRGRSPPA